MAANGGESTATPWNATDTAATAQWNATGAAGGVSCHSEIEGVLGTAAFQTLVYLTYTIVFVVSLVGNGLVCHVVMFSAQMHSVTNLFIMNMAVGDLLMTLFCVPFSFVATLLLQYWPFGSDLCHTVSFAQAVAVLVSGSPPRSTDAGGCNGGGGGGGGGGFSDSRCGGIGGGEGDRGRCFGRVEVCWATFYYILLAPYKRITIYSTYLY